MKRPFIAILFLAASLPVFCQAAELTLQGLPALVLANDPTVSTSEQTALTAYHSYRGTVAQAFPQINFVNTYGLDYVPKNTSLQSFTDSLGIVHSIETEVNDQMGHNLNTSLSLAQLLPTAGNLSLNLGNTMTVSSLGTISLVPEIPGITLPLTTPQFSQVPSVSIKLDQPVLVNGKLLDFDLFPATLRSAQIGFQKADLAKRAQTNQSVFQAAQLFLEIVQLRKAIDQTGKAMSVAQGNLDNLSKSVELGSATEDDLLESKIALSTQKGGLLELRSSLGKAERALAHSIGRQSLEGVSLGEAVPALEFAASQEQTIAKALANHPLIQQANLAREEKKVNDVLAGQRYASDLSLSFQFSPRYPYVNSSNPLDMTFENSFNQLFADGWSQDFKFQASLTIHLFDGGQAREAHAGNLALTRMAEDSLLSQTQAIQDQVVSDYLQKENLDEKISLLSDATELAKRRLDTETSLRDLGKSTDLDVQSRAADYQSKQNDLWRAQADRFMIVIDLTSLTGDDIAQLIKGQAR